MARRRQAGKVWERERIRTEASSVCAVVVSYHPDREAIENLALLRAQAASVVVVDNGSRAETVAALAEACARLGIPLLRNADNLGIAAALNQGVRHAQAAGAGWVLLFDQDSAVTPGYVDAMLGCARAAEERLAILVPRYLDRRTDAVLPPPRGTDGTLDAATTSGSLTPMHVFERAGLFAEELFIDGVDYEFSLRVRRLGLAIVECGAATLLHSPGTPAYHTLLGKRFQAANYSPIRRYYQERNKIWVARRYWHDFAPFCLGQFAISAKDLLKILLVEDDKARKVRFFFRGVLDGLRERMGPARL